MEKELYDGAQAQEQEVSFREGNDKYVHMPTPLRSLALASPQ